MPFASACAAGRATETDKEHQTPYVAHARVGSLLVTDAWLVPTSSTSTPTVAPAASTGSASPTPSASTSAGTSSAPQAYLVAAIANTSNSGDTLTAVTVQGATVDVGGGISIKPTGITQFGAPDSGGQTLGLTGLTQPLATGATVQVTFTFQNAGAVNLLVPVRSSDDYFGSTATTFPVPLTSSVPAIEQEPPDTQHP